LQRQAARDALSEARASALNASFKLEAQVTTLRKENAALKEDAAKLQRVREEEVWGHFTGQSHAHILPV
jgi:hypothetical protein